MRHGHPERLANPAAFTYDPDFVWHLVPEIAKRLGATSLTPNEATRADIVTLHGQEFRECAGCFLADVSRNWSRPAEKKDMPTAADILTHNIANGNPVAFALDRLWPAPSPAQDLNDYVAWHIREISRIRGHDETPYWSPALQLPARSPRPLSRRAATLPSAR